MRLALTIAAVLLAAGSAACSPHIGDNCNNSSDCSANGGRVCDIAQPGGYCTVLGCQADTCPDGAVCVEFRPEPDRLAETWCMAHCSSSGDCRDAYACMHAAELGTNVARIVDKEGESVRFCAVKPDATASSAP